jgi:hypothetical protein
VTTQRHMKLPRPAQHSRRKHAGSPTLCGVAMALDAPYTACRTSSSGSCSRLIRATARPRRKQLFLHRARPATRKGIAPPVIKDRMRRSNRPGRSGQGRLRRVSRAPAPGLGRCYDLVGGVERCRHREYAGDGKVGELLGKGRSDSPHRWIGGYDSAATTPFDRHSASAVPCRTGRRGRCAG